MTMEETFDTLQKLQEVLSEKYAIEREILEIPKALETRVEILSRLKKTYVERNEKYKHTKEHIEQLKVDMTLAEQQREESEKKMDIITTQREYEALDKEIQDSTEREQSLRREVQKREQELSDLSNELEREELLISSQEEELQTENDRIAVETTNKKKQLTSLTEKENEITPGMEKDILFKFERIIRNKSGIGIVPVLANVCSGCHMVLPAQFVNDVRSEESIKFCPYCSRILYWEGGGEPLTETFEFDDEDVGGLSDLVDEDEL